MGHHTTEIIGIIASIFTGISMLPQLVKIIREKEAEDISMLFVAMLMAGLGLWTAYGILRKDIIIVISNSFSLLVNLLIVIFSIKYKKT